MEYTPDEKIVLIKKYLNQYEINVTPEILEQVSKKVDAVPREIHNMCIKIRDLHDLPRLLAVYPGNSLIRTNMHPGGYRDQG